jgi:hypothetical protein
MRGNTRWTAVAIMMDGGSKVAMNKGRSNGQWQHNEQQEGKAIAVGNLDGISSMDGTMGSK